MKKSDLKPAGVTFAAGPHTYTRDADGKQLQGVTTMIQQTLYPREFENIDPEVLSAKAQYGTRRHREIQDMIVFDDEPETPAQHAFADMMKEAGLEAIASEYTVTDGEDFASNIDVVCADGSLVDIKTVARLDRGKVSWQLSLYALFFELTNPGVKAGKLYAAWLPKVGEPRLVEIPRRPETELRELMTAWLEQRPYQRPDIPERELIEQAAALKLQMEAMQSEYDAISAQIFTMMKERGETKYADDFCTVTVRAASTAKRFDSKSFQKAEPEMYARYLRESATPEGLMMRLK